MSFLVYESKKLWASCGKNSRARAAKKVVENLKYVAARYCQKSPQARILQEKLCTLH